MKMIFPLFFIFLLYPILSFGQNQKILRCKSHSIIGGKYKLIGQSRPIGTSEKVHLDIVIASPNFNEKYLTQVARRIDLEYCNESIITANIFDSKESLTGWFEDFVKSAGKIDSRRGTYLLNRKTGEEIIEISKQKGNPLNEIRIDTSKEKLDSLVLGSTQRNSPEEFFEFR